MTHAVEAAKPVAEQGAGVASVLAAAGDAWAAKAGGTSGVLWGAALRSLGARLGDDSDDISGADVAAAVKAGADRMQELGKAQLGDKTMLDALLPFADALAAGVAQGKPLAQAWADAAQVATSAAQETADLKPKLGRARPLAERIVGTPDPGATSLAMCTRVVGEVLGTADEGNE